MRTVVFGSFLDIYSHICGGRRGAHSLGFFARPSLISNDRVLLERGREEGEKKSKRSKVARRRAEGGGDFSDC